MLLAFKWVGDPKALETAKNRMQAHLMEMRLYDREPRLVLRAAGSLLVWNARFFVASLRPALIATVPMILLFVQMEGYYGLSPLRPGSATVVSAALDAPADGVELRADNGLVVETPGARSAGGTLISWRVRALDVSGHAALKLQVGDRELEKSVSVGTKPMQVSPRRVRAPGDVLLYPVELPLDAPGVREIRVQYAPRSIELFGIESHWLVWLVLVSVLGAFVVRAVVNRIHPGAL